MLQKNVSSTQHHLKTCSFLEQANAQNLQTTLASTISCKGVALHTGQEVELKLIPADADTGILIHRSDLADSYPFPVRHDRIVDTQLSTVVACKENPSLKVATIEHLMAALHGLEIDNVIISLNGPEVPILDGSADSFTFLIRCAGQKTLEAPRRVIKIRQTVRVEGKDGAFAELQPTPQDLSLAISLDFAASAIGHQRYAMTLDKERFLKEISFCRTFVNLKDIEYLHSIGLARGGSLENAIVVDNDHILNPEGLRIDREFARHKLLDAIGDLYCSGYRIQGGFIGHKSGHKLNNELLHAVFSDPKNWSFEEPKTSIPLENTPIPSCVAA
ncbi:UDP-3-O-acyl-N-acetylglucosamine deacetylase [Swingsia samuiensis]|uniref:UDP-3-O-acyl-N-acetylglucosamine deacetylase n=1 Tax=Swingsia samuiensis TaxID=1293412 RepID=A0A4Y6UHJ3_9PROT|nr:UDP-3-O-acyl-N-acetylglucosamine deacetylase [Swingsia samuiensis]QDH16280.1 UDP-3-O-acyl-N-acetylglucosamine deacetylase [Swingsia samuiensis]